MKAIFKREMRSYFTTMIGYVFIGVFMFLSGLFFSMGMFRNRVGSVTGIMPMCMVILMLLMPIITMRLMAEERANKTDQLLLTAPVKVTEIVMGKYFAAFTVFLLSTATTLFYVLVAAVWGDIAFGETFCSYLGYILFGALLIAIGMYISSLTENQVVAAVLTYGVTLLLFFSSWINTGIGFVDYIIGFFQIAEWNESFSMGVIAPSGVVYYLSFTFLFLLLSARVTESRRWR